MAKELAPFNIRCNSISPGLTNTEMLINLQAKKIKNKQINFKIAQPEEIVDVILLLASKNHHILLVN